MILDFKTNLQSYPLQIPTETKQRNTSSLLKLTLFAPAAPTVCRHRRKTTKNRLRQIVAIIGGSKSNCFQSGRVGVY